MVTKYFVETGIETETVAMINIVPGVTPDRRFHHAIRAAANDAIRIVPIRDRIRDPIPLNVTPEVRAVLDTMQIRETVEHGHPCHR